MPGYRAGFVRQVDALVRARVAAIFAAHFGAEAAAEHAGVLARSEALARWVAALLARARREEAAA